MQKDSFRTQPYTWQSSYSVAYPKIFIIILLLFITGCGFHLKGTFTIQNSLKILRISPHQPTDPLQKILRKSLKSNGVQIVEPQNSEATSVLLLTILSQTFTEKTVAYGADGQANRSVIQFNITYQISNSSGKIIFSNGTIKVERLLTINPNAVLGTDNERNYVNEQLYIDAASQLMRQLSIMKID
jgi:LPS-assembly lipoprotein